MPGAAPHYKFIGNPDDVRFILGGRLKFARIDELNDPSELVARLDPDEVRESLRRLRRDGYSEGDLQHLRHQGALLARLAPQFLAVSAPVRVEQANALIRSPFYDQLDRLEVLLTETAATISARVGVLCLTQRYDSLPMWAHYASNAAGLVVEFRDLDRTFAGDETGVLRSLHEVRYERELHGVTFDPRSHLTILFSKFSDWSYEAEVRVVMALDDCKVVPIGERTIHCYDLDPSHIVRLYCGWRMDDAAVERVLGHVRSINPEVEVARLGIVRGGVQLMGRLYP